MSNYIEHNGKIAFHPGYYISEVVEESGLTHEDYAKRLGTTPKNLSLLIRGKQSLSPEMAFLLSRITGASMEYWLNLQNRFDELKMEFKADDEMKSEERILDFISYQYLRDNFGLPDLPRRKREQVEAARKFLGVSSLVVFSKEDMAVSFRSASSQLPEQSIVKANVMVQIAVNRVLKVDVPEFDYRKFVSAVNSALALTCDHDTFYESLRRSFLEAGVVFEILPNLPGSRINGATKKIGKSIMLMVNDRCLFSDIFWFTLFHEIGHVMNRSYGISFDCDSGTEEDAADNYARDSLVPPDAYAAFISERRFGRLDIISFASSINRDPAIILGRLQHDGFVGFDNMQLNRLKRRYKVKSIKSNVKNSGGNGC